jgi:hypothetical protein
MHVTVPHLVLLVFSVGFSAIGWFMAHNPACVYRVFNWGGTHFGQTSLERFFQIVGWCFTVIFAASALLQVILTLQALRR